MASSPALGAQRAWPAVIVKWPEWEDQFPGSCLLGQHRPVLPSGSTKDASKPQTISVLAPGAEIVVNSQAHGVPWQQ